MATVANELFSSQKMGKLHEYFLRTAATGKPIEYEILVDGLKAVPRTKKPEHFDNYKLLVDDQATCMQIIFYKGSSNHNDRCNYYFKEVPVENALNVNDLDEKHLLKVTQESESAQADLTNEINRLKKLANEKDIEITELGQELKEIQAKQSPPHSLIGKDQFAILYLQKLSERFSLEQFIKIISILDVFAIKTSLVDDVEDLLKGESVQLVH